MTIKQQEPGGGSDYRMLGGSLKEGRETVKEAAVSGMPETVDFRSEGQSKAIWELT